MDVETKNRRDSGRDRSKERKRRYERVKRIDPEDEYDRDVGEKREKREGKDRRRRDRERKKINDSEEEDERDKRRAKEKERRRKDGERDRRGSEKERKRERSKEDESDDDVKRNLNYGDDNGGQKQVDEEGEKRRRRFQEWQELKRKKEEAEIESKTCKAWTLEGESDDDEQVPPQMDVDGETNPEDEEVIDPLDAFMNNMVLPEVGKLSNTASSLAVNDGGDQPKKGINQAIIQGEDSDSDYSEPKSDDDPSLDEDDEEFMKIAKKTKGEKLSLVDHSEIEYKPFRKNFYIQANDISKMTEEQVSAYRKELELKVHGKDVPRPVKSWYQTGLTNRILDTMKKLNYEKPMPVQAQALPVIMSGRDCIGVAKTGSGKTLGFVLPMLRHIKDQPPAEAGDGPVGLVMAPTRELVQQIHTAIKKFAKALSIRCVPVYGGSEIAQQISKLKRGTDIIVCTPGRMIDILCTNSGKITNLQRVTFLVMDEADRMFDMGFEPQVTRIIQNIRPDRQTVLFSATFPRQIENLARRVLNKPVEIQAGGKNVVNKDITQSVEIIAESERNSRLVELIEEWYERGKILVFVGSQGKCDALYNDLKNKCGYSSISEFKSKCKLLIATSVAARGLDVKELELVVNFDVPNHYEEYVHRVGRTGRAGRKGCAVTFISEDDAKYAPDLVKALELSEQPVPGCLKAIADGFMAKVKQGIEKAHGSGYGGSGFKFNEEDEEVKKAQAKEYGYEEDKSDSEDENDVVVRKAASAAVNQLLPNGLQHTLAKIQADAMPE
ncbi:hypothetical protein EUTSA_v10022167mg, partial [Eutrema salsugineum]